MAASHRIAETEAVGGRSQGGAVRGANPSARMLYDLLRLEGEDLAGAVEFAKGWTEDQIDTLTLSEDYESADLYLELMELRRVEVTQ